MAREPLNETDREERSKRKAQTELAGPSEER